MPPVKQFLCIFQFATAAHHARVGSFKARASLSWELVTRNGCRVNRLCVSITALACPWLPGCDDGCRRCSRRAAAVAARSATTAPVLRRPTGSGVHAAHAAADAAAVHS